MLLDEYLSLFFLATEVLIGFTVNEHDYVGILFDRTGIAKVRKARFATALFDCAGELGES